MEGRDLRANYEEDLNRLKQAQTDAAIASLANTRNQALSNLEAEKQANSVLYNQQRSSANAQNRMNAKNFQEYLASTGRANSGLPAQAKMQYNNNLNTSINYLNAGEAGALADINRRRTDAQNAYDTGLAGANANIEANYITNLLDQRNKEAQRELQERQLQEQIRQFNENMALQREKLYNTYYGGSSYSSGGNSYSNSTTNNSSNSGTTNSTYNSASDTAGAAQQYGTFSNGYQPKGILGYGALSKTGDTIDVNGKTQNVWQTPDGNLWYWDGNSRQYYMIRSHTAGGGRHG